MRAWLLAESLDCRRRAEAATDPELRADLMRLAAESEQQAQDLFAQPRALPGTAVLTRAEG